MNVRFARMAAVALVALAIGLPARSQEQKKPAPKELAKAVQQADKLEAEGKPIEARDQYLAVLKDDPTNAAVALKVARISENISDWDGAISAYRIAAANTQGADQARAYASLAAACRRRGMYQESAESARKAVALDPTLAQARLDLAYSLLRTGAADEAVGAAQKAIELVPSSAPAHVTLGQARLAQGGAADADAAFRKALELDPKSSDAYVGLAEVAYGKRDYEGAIATASKALDLDTSQKRALVVRGKANLALDRLAPASSDLQTAVMVNADDPDAQMAFARLQRKQGNLDMSATAYRKALALDPNLVEASLDLAELLIERADYETASDLLNPVLQRTPPPARALGLMGVVHEKRKEVDAALAAYSRAVEADPTLADFHHRRGKLLHEQKHDLVNAVASLQKAVDLNPTRADYLTDLGVAQYDQKDFDKAIEALQKAVATSDYKNPTGFAVLGLAYKDKQSFADGLVWLEKAAVLAPSWWLPHWGAAWCYFGTIKKGCPCGADDADRVAKMKAHVEQLTALQKPDPTLQQRLDALLQGQKIK